MITVNNLLNIGEPTWFAIKDYQPTRLNDVTAPTNMFIDGYSIIKVDTYTIANDYQVKFAANYWIESKNLRKICKLLKLIEEKTKVDVEWKISFWKNNKIQKVFKGKGYEGFRKAVQD